MRGATPKKTMLDPWPRWVLVPGVGLFGAGGSRREAAVAADVAETTIDVVTAAEALGRFESISEAELFDMEYWSLETQAKLGKAEAGAFPGPARLWRMTGERGNHRRRHRAPQHFAAQGAQVAVLDRDTAAAKRVAGSAVKGLDIACDVH